MPQESTLHKVDSGGLRTGDLRRYDYTGDTKLVFYEATDAAAKKQLLEHFNIPELTLDAFRRVGGKHLKCGNRQVFPPAGNA